jgi:hypothetical protein
MKIVLFPCLFFFLSACATVPFTKSMTPHPQQKSAMQPQEMFHAAMGDYSASKNLELMFQLQKQYPDSNWADHAETIILLAREVSQLAEDKNQSAAELDILTQENIKLNEKIEQLKSLLIELEQRPQ